MVSGLQLTTYHRYSADRRNWLACERAIFPTLTCARKSALRMFPVPTGTAGPRYDRMNTLRTVAIVAVFFYHAFTATFSGSTDNMRAVSATWPEWMRVASVVGFTTLSIGYHLVSIFFVM